MGGPRDSREHSLEAGDLRKKIQNFFVTDRQAFRYLALDPFCGLMRLGTIDRFPATLSPVVPPDLSAAQLYGLDCPLLLNKILLQLQGLDRLPTLEKDTSGFLGVGS